MEKGMVIRRSQGELSTSIGKSEVLCDEYTGEGDGNDNERDAVGVMGLTKILRRKVCIDSRSLIRRRLIIGRRIPQLGDLLIHMSSFNVIGWGEVQRTDPRRPT